MLCSSVSDLAYEKPDAGDRRGSVPMIMAYNSVDESLSTPSRFMVKRLLFLLSLCHVRLKRLLLLLSLCHVRLKRLLLLLSLCHVRLNS